MVIWDGNECLSSIIGVVILLIIGIAICGS